MTPSTFQIRIATFLFFGLSLLAGEALAQRGAGKHSRGKTHAMPSKKTMARPSVSHSPSMHRPSPKKSNLKNNSIRQPNTRPSSNFSNKKQPNIKFPTQPRPSISGNKTRPQTNRPTPSQINQFMDFRNPSSKPSQRPQGGAAGNFLKDRPSTHPAVKTHSSTHSSTGNTPRDESSNKTGGIKSHQLTKFAPRTTRPKSNR